MPRRLSHVVVMGMGEPLLNLDALLPALAAAADRDGLGIGARRITISTVGLPEGIRRLARENCQYHLAVSLHAANDALRNEIVPANRGFGIAAILAAADEYFEQTGRRVTFEYVLLSGVNDRPEHAGELVKLLRGRPALVNLIPYNPVPGLPYRTPPSSVTARFVEILTQGGLNVNIRHRKGDRIAAACGQLRRGEQGSRQWRVGSGECSSRTSVSTATAVHCHSTATAHCHSPLHILLARLQPAAPLAEMLHADQQPLGHGRQRLGGDADRQAGLLVDEAVDPPQQRPAAAEHQAVVDQIGGQVGTAMVERGLDGLEDFLQADRPGPGGLPRW